MSISSASGAFTWAPIATQNPGDYPLTVRVTDSGTPPLSANQTITIHLLGANTKPVLQPIANRTIAAGNQLLVTNVATDIDLPAQTLTFSLDPGTAGVPAGAAINPASGVFSWTPGTGQAGNTYPITVRVSDNGTPSLSDSQTFNITVPQNNSAPALDPIGDKTLTKGSTLTFTA